MTTIKLRHERGTTVFEVSWKDAGDVSMRVCRRDDAVHADIAERILSRKLSQRARSRPWSLVLELSRKDVCEAGDLDEYFAGLADALYGSMLDADPDADIPREIEVSWPGSAYAGVYRAVTYKPSFEDDPADV